MPEQKTRRHRSKKVGRGYGTGKGGHTIGKGTKGQKSRSGAKIRPGFAGGQNPLYKALPQYRGFKPSDKKAVGVNISILNAKFNNSDVVTISALRQKGILQSDEKSAKIIGDGDIKKKLTIRGIALSKTAEEKILKAGGKIDA